MKVGKVEFDFKPKFGNADHIRALGMVGEINKNLKELKEKEAGIRVALELRKHIKKQYKELDTYLKFIKNKSNEKNKPEGASGSSVRA